MLSPALSSAAIESEQAAISATVDTSVYIRALHFGGPATLIIGHARAGSIRIDISDAIVAETNRVLRDKFQWDGYSLPNAREELRALGNHVSPTETGAHTGDNVITFAARLLPPSPSYARAYAAGSARYFKRYTIVVSVSAGSGVGSPYISHEWPPDSLRFAAIHLLIASCAWFMRL